MTEPASPAPAGPASAPLHTILLLDASSSIRPFLEELIPAANAVLDQQRSTGGLISIVFFNADIAHFAWRSPAAQAPRLTALIYPIDGGTALYDAITGTVEQLVYEHTQSRGEMNAAGDVRIVIFTDGEDRSSRMANRMRTRLALGEARQRGWDILFVSNIAGLAGDLGIDPHASVPIDLRPGHIQSGFLHLTQRISADDMRRILRTAEPPLPPLPVDDPFDRD